MHVDILTWDEHLMHEPATWAFDPPGSLPSRVLCITTRLIPCTEELWEVAVDYINVGEPVLIEIHKVRV